LLDSLSSFHAFRGAAPRAIEQWRKCSALLIFVFNKDLNSADRDRLGRFEDAGISGAKDREQRPGLDALMKAVARREIDMVAAWSVDRLGRSLTGLLELLTELHAKKVDLYLHQQGLDTSTPSGRAMFQMMGVFAEFERAMIRERVLAGLARARQAGTHLGRKFTEDTQDGSRKVKTALEQIPVRLQRSPSGGSNLRIRLR
jgi:DNA invertase Pin-like site-specific DNA recombinase